MIYVFFLKLKISAQIFVGIFLGLIESEKEVWNIFSKRKKASELNWLEK